MIIGEYWSKYGIYKFNGAHYKPRWFGKYGMDPLALQNLAIEGYNNDSNWPRAIIVLDEKRWNVVKVHYPDIYGLTQLHCFALGQAGNIPTWANPWKSSAYLLLHEYALPTVANGPSKVAWMRPEQLFANDIYAFFQDATTAEINQVENPAPPVNTPADDDDVIVIPSIARKWRVTGKLWFMDVDLTIEAEDGVLTFYVNGERIDSYKGGDPYGTEISLFINVDEGASARYYFDNALVRTNDF